MLKSVCYINFVHVSPFRGIQLGRPELVKTWEKFEHKKSVKAEKGKSSDNELESRFRSISQKQEVRIVTCPLAWSNNLLLIQ